jgi:hypothetical protein
MKTPRSFYQPLLGLQSPWTVSHMTLRQRAKCGLVSGACGDRNVDVPAVGKNTAALQPEDEERPGGTWTVITSRHTCMREFPAWFAASMACGFRNIEYFETAITSTVEGSISTHARPGSAIVP